MVNTITERHTKFYLSDGRFVTRSVFEDSKANLALTFFANTKDCEGFFPSLTVTFKRKENSVGIWYEEDSIVGCPHARVEILNLHFVR